MWYHLNIYFTLKCSVNSSCEWHHVSHNQTSKNEADIYISIYIYIFIYIWIYDIAVLIQVGWLLLQHLDEITGAAYVGFFCCCFDISSKLP